MPPTPVHTPIEMRVTPQQNWVGVCVWWTPARAGLGTTAVARVHTWRLTHGRLA